mmetsp:Transcript_62319/g.190438  ORF Transcript_62319/g.190438 Transcript_62319/m.190438 type:complete len:209 (-) Transcript_62319:308-934(-)
MVFNMIVSHIHELEHVGIIQRRIAKFTAICFVVQPTKPNPLPCRTPVLLQHSRLESHGLFEPGNQLILRIVRKRVHEPNGQASDFDKRTFRTHLCLHARQWPNNLSFGTLFCNEGIKFVLRSRRRSLGKLPGIDAYDESIVPCEQSSKVVMSITAILDYVASSARLDHAVGDRNRINAMTIGPLVCAAVLCVRHIELDDRQNVLCIWR